MRILNSEFSIESFWGDLKTASASTLMLDYDGTLSPFTSERNEAIPYSGVSERLKTLIESSTTEVIIISGRDIKTLKGLLSLENYPEIWGSHGAERSSSRKGYQLLVDINVIKGLRQVKDWIARNKLDQVAELKPAGCAFHWRGLETKEADEIESTVRDYWEPKANSLGMTLHLFDGGIELRPVGLDKGNAVRRILDNRADEIPIAYLGDDLTDEDAFKAIGNRGLKVLVNRNVRSTAADLHVVPPAELIEFLDKWIECSSVKSQ
jgi:trehalose 6-phosphate phosphatase